MLSLPPFPTREDIENLLYALDQYAPPLPNIREIVVHIYEDLSRYGPPVFPEINVPSLGGTIDRFVQVPAPPPPPPPPKGTVEKVTDWIMDNKWTVALGILTTAGAITYYGYKYDASRGDRLAAFRRKRLGKRIRASAGAGLDQREIVVILGVDAIPYGRAIVRYFQEKGFIVIASVSTSDAIEETERAGDGYVRALVLDPEEPGSIPHFLRSLSSTLSLRFPTTLHGDPYLSMSASRTVSNLPRVASIISLLSLAPADLAPFSAFSSPVSLTQSYLPHLSARALTPLSVIQAILPLFKHRKGLGNPTDDNAHLGSSVIVCLPATARVGVAGSSGVTMASSALSVGLDVLRREIDIDPEVDLGLGDVSFVTFDVGEVKEYGRRRRESKWAKWSGGRRPSDVSVLSEALIGVVKGRREPWSLEWFHSLWLGDRRSIGAGASTYVMASRLPPRILDFLLALPYHLESIRTSLSAASQAHQIPPQPVLPTTAKTPSQQVVETIHIPPTAPQPRPDDEQLGSGPNSATTSEMADEYLSEGEGSKASGMEDSWVVHDQEEAPEVLVTEE